MITTIKKLLGLGCALIVFPSATTGQSLQQQGIASTTQILDTSVLFAIGAREAEQALRGSFGWPTFQEGFVDRVYFRFDPDGYARFSSSPRLDEDVFEVICAESSTACLAKKPSLEIGLTVEGKIQIKIADITPQDTFFVSDRKSELPLPPTILEPLDARLETLLASGGHLIVKREVETVQEISLAGFSAVSTYLRWVAQGQSSRVFPRGWPVPAQVNSLQAGGLTQADTWVAPNVGPQQGQTTFSQAQGYQNTQLQTRQVQPVQPGVIGGQFNATGSFGSRSAQDQQLTAQAQSTIQSLQRELASLRASQEGLTQRSDTQAVDDVAIGFAQQAQARDLHTPVGYGSEVVVQQAQAQPIVPRDDFERSVVPSPSAGSVGIDYQTLNALEARLFALENSILHLRDVLLAEMRDIKALPAEPLTRMTEISVVPEKVQAEAEPESMDALEKLLLERLSKRDPIPVASDVAVEAAVPSEATLERTRIMDLLKQLEPETGEEVGVIQDEITPAVEAPQSEGFVTLSDYINQVLKSEGQGLKISN
jgi:hypothetical protein